MLGSVAEAFGVRSSMGPSTWTVGGGAGPEPVAVVCIVAVVFELPLRSNLPRILSPLDAVLILLTPLESVGGPEPISLAPSESAFVLVDNLRVLALLSPCPRSRIKASSSFIRSTLSSLRSSAAAICSSFMTSLINACC